MTKLKSAKRCTLIATAALMGLGMGSTAVAADGASMSFRLNAHVASFCRISAPFDGLTLPASAIDNDSLFLGAVREVCNNPGGYRVEARFMNVRTGTLMIDERANALTDGTASYITPQAARQVRVWRLADLETAAQDQPILVRLSISPL